MSKQGEKKEAKTIIGTFRQSSKYIESIERIFCAELNIWFRHHFADYYQCEKKAAAVKEKSNQIHLTKRYFQFVNVNSDEKKKPSDRHTDI